MAERLIATEWLDNPALPDSVVAQSYRQLARTHKFLGNTGAVVRRLRSRNPPVHSVLDIGCGQGALLDVLHRRLGVRVTGIDLRRPPPGSPVHIITGDAVRDALPEADAAVSVCVAHHLSEAELTMLIQNVGRSCKRFIVLDLVRHPLPLILFSVFVAPMLSPLNAADGKTSVRRAFTPGELRKIVESAVRGANASVRHTVAPFYIRQIVEITWPAK